MKNDITIAIKYFDLYFFLACQDINSRFRRSYLGIFWVVVQQLFFSIIAGFIWAKIFGLDPMEFIPFITVGFALWTFISASMVDGCNTFVIAHGYLKQLPLPQSIFIFRTLLSATFYLCVSLSTALGLLVIFNKLVVIGILYMLPGLAMLLLYFYGAAGAMAYLGLRYRDLQHALSAVFSLLFIITPVIYPPEVLIQRGISVVVYLNPFTSLIEVIRVPLLTGHLAGSEHYAISFAFIACLIVCKLILSRKWGRFVPFWA